MSFLYKILADARRDKAKTFCDKESHQFANQAVEHLVIGYYDDQYRLIQIGEFCSNLVDAVSIPIRNITQLALNLNARSIMLMHNHPRGDANPSQSDIKQTRDIARILGPLGVVINDHLIVAADHQFSFRQAGLL
ncbi:MAG: JAB domain-containing protein [Pseudomonadota bacterium]